MADYIEREAVMQALLDEQYGYLCEDAVRAIPAADVKAVVRGTWVGLDDFPHEDWECDHCGCAVENIEDPWNHYHFCPNCGAEMLEPDKAGGPIPWTLEAMTEKQRKCIDDMQEYSQYPLPRFTGKTKGEAHAYIEKWGRLGFEDPNSKTFGY